MMTAKESAQLKQIAPVVHKNAVKHGWWEGKRTNSEVIALIHAEWSEALEEYRDGKPLVYFKDGKPEGQAVELIDGVLRILDFMESELYKKCGLYSYQIGTYVGKWSLPKLVTILHRTTADESNFFINIELVFGWLKRKGIAEPMELLKLKHRYNLTRPYKHGGKVI